MLIDKVIDIAISDIKALNSDIEQRHVSINQLQKCPSSEEIKKRIDKYNSGKIPL